MGDEAERKRERRKAVLALDQEAVAELGYAVGALKLSADIIGPEELPLIRQGEAPHKDTCGTVYRGCAPDCHARALAELDQAKDSLQEARALWDRLFADAVRKGQLR